MKLHRLAVCAALVAASASSAFGYSAVNRFIVQAAPNGNFVVLSQGGLSSPNAWCAAGDYAMSVLGVQPGTLIWRVSEPPRPRGANIEFSLSSAGAASSTGLNTLGGNGASMAAVSARNLCRGLSIPGQRR